MFVVEIITHFAAVVFDFSLHENARQNKSLDDTTYGTYDKALGASISGTSSVGLDNNVCSCHPSVTRRLLSIPPPRFHHISTNINAERHIRVDIVVR